MYLRLIWDQPPDDGQDEKAAIEAAFRYSPFRLTSPLMKHPRGGYGFHANCRAEDVEAIVQLLRDHNLLSVI
ncbi:hypothetical protein C5Y96_00770 [Blastopirellula marina]|uniref:Uncharacterized protein n=1 Tax=Blastopirellula marina TaxID=124 RepID=A0A2S8GA23_9BACT|nr:MULTISPECIES: hypothetical protein [Pirellulaceae]PQO41277.1 hypothetical protein C5Y96_00770 [Blastopirellula marina]RCS56301.1 hypothetical protein DTL36_00770 [Bremerella cremea]